jgi:peroxiredoxin
MALQLGNIAQSYGPLKAADGKNYGLADFKEKIIVVIFSCNHCPYVVAYEDRIIAIQKDYAEKGVRVVAINSNDSVKYPDDGFEKMVVRAKEKHFNFSYLHDADQAVARAFGATNTPHVFVLDEKRALRYVGRIDDAWDHPERVKTRDLRNALNALIEGREPKPSSTLPVGCSIKWK